MSIPIPSGKERIAYEGKIFEVVKQLMKIGNKEIEFEVARRAPGVRLLIVKQNKILITKEFRTEINGSDYRLPGGKVFDTLAEYRKAREHNANILVSAEAAARKECREEVGLTPLKISHFYTAHAGATVEWDLYYFLVEDFKESQEGQQLEDGEHISVEWKTFPEVKKMCLEHEIKEDRSVAVLLQFILSQGK